jgi:glucokinase
VVYLTFSTGIGAGIISDGHLLSGAGGNAGEVGHLFVDSQYRLPCGCGGYGHWEAYASGTGIPNFFRAFCDQPPEKSLTGILKDPLYREFTGELARINGRGLSSVIAVYNPDLIILDGPVARNYPSLLAGNRYIEHYLELPEIRISALEGRAPLLGAAAAAFQGLP